MLRMAEAFTRVIATFTVIGEIETELFFVVVARAPTGVTKPAAGVITTRPPTAPEQKPSTVGLPRVNFFIRPFGAKLTHTDGPRSAVRNVQVDPQPS